MRKINSRPRAAWPAFAVSLAFSVLAYIWPADWFLVGEFFRPIVLAAVISFFVGIFLASAKLVWKIRRAVALRALPKVRGAVKDNPTIFAREGLPPLPPDPPEMKSGLLEYLSNEREMTSYLDQLNKLRWGTHWKVQEVVSRFESDWSEVENQQIDLYRMAHIAQGLARKIQKRFPDIKPDLTAVPEAKPLPTVAPPALLTKQHYEKRFGRLSRASAVANRAAMSSGNVLVAGAAVVGTAAAGIVLFQKSVREMHESAGLLRRHMQSAEQTLEALGRAHREIAVISREVASQTEELRELILFSRNWIQGNGGRSAGIRNADAPDEHEVRQKLTRLCSYALLARVHAARAA